MCSKPNTSHAHKQSLALNMCSVSNPTNVNKDSEELIIDDICAMPSESLI